MKQEKAIKTKKNVQGSCPPATTGYVSYCEEHRHDYEEEYYGYKCKKCNSFIPFGCEPWVLDEDIDDEDEICGYECLCCGSTQVNDGSCNYCTAYALEPLYF